MFDLLDTLGLDYRKLPPALIRLSYRSCSALTGSAESWCSLAYANERRILICLLGRMHCAACYHWHRRKT